MSGPQVFFCGENGDVIHWDINDPPIKMGPSAVDMFGPIGVGDDRENVGRAGACCPSGPDGDIGSVGSNGSPEMNAEYTRGYQNALKDVLNEIARSGKQNL